MCKHCSVKMDPTGKVYGREWQSTMVLAFPAFLGPCTQGTQMGAENGALTGVLGCKGVGMLEVGGA